MFSKEMQDIFQPIAGRLPANPQFEIVRSIIRALAVLMMHRFPWKKRSTQDRRHHDSVFENCSPADSGGTIAVLGKVSLSGSDPQRAGRAKRTPLTAALVMHATQAITDASAFAAIYFTRKPPLFQLALTMGSPTLMPLLHVVGPAKSPCNGLGGAVRSSTESVHHS